jgi:hypothetical protein
MQRFHKQVLFPDIYDQQLKEVNDDLNRKEFSFSKHSLDNVKWRAIDMTELLLDIKERFLSVDNIFEYYVSNGIIKKVCYRIHMKSYDYIIVLSLCKKVITIYINSKNDNHICLNKSLYCSTV